MKKGQGLSLNTIIIAAIVLIVLIVLWAIFTGRMAGFSTGVKEQATDCDGLCQALGKSPALKNCGSAAPDGVLDGENCCCTQKP